MARGEQERGIMPLHREKPKSPRNLRRTLEYVYPYRCARGEAA